MALTNWNDILNKPKGIDQIDEIALEVSELSSSVLTIAGDVQELELSVADLSASVLTIGEKIDDNIIYSSTETECGEWFTDKLYKKSFVLDMPNNDTVSVEHAIANIKSIIKIDAVANKSDDNTTHILPIANITANANAFVTINQSYITLISNYNTSTYKAFVTVYYTKTATQETKKKTTKKN